MTDERPKSIMRHQKTAIIIGAGPAGLTAAYELLERTNIKPIVFEKTDDVGGIAKTVNYRGNRIDIGGHRFFSKSDRVMNWWQNILPLEKTKGDQIEITYHHDKKTINTIEEQGIDPEKTNKVMLIRSRLSRILFEGKFYDYPISLNLNTIRNLGLIRLVKIGLSYGWARFFPITNERSLEDFFINRFGRELYETFFKDYTEKVWGVPCEEISAEWGAQRVKGLSVSKAIIDAIKKIFQKTNTISQKNTETSLIQLFLYPKLGPGQMWQEVANIIRSKGGKIYFHHEVVGLTKEGNRLSDITVKNTATNQSQTVSGDYFFSTMPVKELLDRMTGQVPEGARNIAHQLEYRDFITVGLLLKKLRLKNNRDKQEDLIRDNWIYIQEKDVKVGRLQIFNNWSPYLVKNPATVWIGLEYFCKEGDTLWNLTNHRMIALAKHEMEKIKIIDQQDVLDATVIRMPKTYPSYFGAYKKFHHIRTFTDTVENLFLIGRNGMHHYNNQDHSMLTAMTAVENINNNVYTKDNIWQVNTEEDYHEEK